MGPPSELSLLTGIGRNPRVVQHVRRADDGIHETLLIVFDIDTEPAKYFGKLLVIHFLFHFVLLTHRAAAAFWAICLRCLEVSRFARTEAAFLAICLRCSAVSRCARFLPPFAPSCTKNSRTSFGNFCFMRGRLPNVPGKQAYNITLRVLGQWHSRGDCRSAFFFSVSFKRLLEMFLTARFLTVFLLQLLMRRTERTSHNAPATIKLLGLVLGISGRSLTASATVWTPFVDHPRN